jgi:hypothetical protein
LSFAHVTFSAAVETKIVPPKQNPSPTGKKEMDLKRMILFTSAAMLLASCGKSKDTTLIVPLLLSAGTQNGASPADAGTDQTPATLGTVDALTSPAVEPASEDLEDTDSAEDAEQEPNAPNDTAETADISCDRTVAIDTSAGNWFETPRSTRDERSVSGIHTYWQDQALMVHVRGNCKAGWFRIRVTAKNTAGPLPSWYSHFLVGVKDSDRSHDYERASRSKLLTITTAQAAGWCFCRKVTRTSN